jgi:hypothetical protein
MTLSQRRADAVRKELETGLGTAYRYEAEGKGETDPVAKEGGTYIDPGWATFRTDPGTSNRDFFYVPAPPPTVKSVTFNAGPFGELPNIPIQ